MAGPGQEVSWHAFTRGLATELVRLPDEAVLVIAAEGDPGCFVQVARANRVTLVEASVDRDLAPQGYRLMVAAGWRPPGGDQKPTWSFYIPSPIHAARYRRVAEACVLALRDGFGIGAPDSLVYRAWCDNALSWLELPELGIAAAER